MALSNDQHNFYSRLSNNQSSEKLEALVEEYLSQGGDPNIRIPNKNEFKSALGICCHRAATGAVHRLLAAGAKPHWPRKAISQKSLTGSDEEEYEGLNVDALGIALEMMGGYLVEHAESDKPSKRSLSEEVGGHQEVVRALLLAGADPTRPDPAHRRKPLDSLMVQLVESCHSEPDPTAQAVLEETIFILAKHSGQLEEVAKGNWQGSPLCDFDWSDDYPALVTSLRSLAQQELLRYGTETKQRSPRKPRL